MPDRRRRYFANGNERIELPPFTWNADDARRWQERYLGRFEYDALNPNDRNAQARARLGFGLPPENEIVQRYELGMHEPLILSESMMQATRDLAARLQDSIFRAAQGMAASTREFSPYTFYADTTIRKDLPMNDLYPDWLRALWNERELTVSTLGKGLNALSIEGRTLDDLWGMKNNSDAPNDAVRGRYYEHRALLEGYTWAAKRLLAYITSPAASDKGLGPYIYTLWTAHRALSESGIKLDCLLGTMDYRSILGTSQRATVCAYIVGDEGNRWIDRSMDAHLCTRLAYLMHSALREPLPWISKDALWETARLALDCAENMDIGCAPHIAREYDERLTVIATGLPLRGLRADYTWVAHVGCYSLCVETPYITLPGDLYASNERIAQTAKSILNRLALA